MGEDEIQNVNNKNRDEIKMPQFLHRGVESIKQDSMYEGYRMWG